MLNLRKGSGHFPYADGLGFIGGGLRSGDVEWRSED